jgi:hypothetical protein
VAGRKNERRTVIRATEPPCHRRIWGGFAALRRANSRPATQPVTADYASAYT